MNEIWDRERQTVFPPPEVKVDGRSCISETLLSPVDLGFSSN